MMGTGVLALAVVAVAAKEPCEDRVAALEAQVTALVEQLRTVTADVNRHEQQLSAQLVEEARTGVHDERGPSPELGRRLTSSSTYVPVPSYHVHEFPSGHSCSLGSGDKMFMPVEGGNAAMQGPTTPTETVGIFDVDPKEYTATTIQTFSSPLKVVHESNCQGPPSLAVPLNTNFEGTLSVSSNNVLTSKASNTRSTIPRHYSAFNWNIDATHADIWGAGSLYRNNWAYAYYNCAMTFLPITSMAFVRMNNFVSGHTMLGFTTSTTTSDDFQHASDGSITGFWMWFSHASDSFGSGVRTACPPVSGALSGYIFHGTDAEVGAGSTAPADDNRLIDSDTGDTYEISLVGTTVSFFTTRYERGNTPFRTCTVPSGNYYGKINMYAPNQYLNSLPGVTFA